MKSVILGINFGGHDTSAALMIDGQLIAACEEERYIGEKHTRQFPTNAIRDCLSTAQVDVSDAYGCYRDTNIDVLVVGDYIILKEPVV